MVDDGSAHGVTWKWEGGSALRLYKCMDYDHGLDNDTTVLIGAVWPIEALPSTSKMFYDIDRSRKYYATYWPQDKDASHGVFRYFDDMEEAQTWVICLARIG